MALSHYLNQYRLILPQPETTKVRWKIIQLKFHLNLPGANKLNWLSKIGEVLHEEALWYVL